MSFADGTKTAESVEDLSGKVGGPKWTRNMEAILRKEAETGDYEYVARMINDATGSDVTPAACQSKLKRLRRAERDENLVSWRSRVHEYLQEQNHQPKKRHRRNSF